MRRMSMLGRTRAGIVPAKVEPVEQEYMTTKGVMDYLGGVSRDFVDDLKRSGRLPFCKIGHTILYKVSDVKKAIEKHRIY